MNITPSQLPPLSLFNKEPIPERTHSPETIAQAKDTASKLVATTLIKPILAQARATRNAPAPWGQTQAEKQFGALLDTKLADDIAQASTFPITERIAKQILRNAPLQDPQSPPSPQPQPLDLFG